MFGKELSNSIRKDLKSLGIKRNIASVKLKYSNTAIITLKKGINNNKIEQIKKIKRKYEKFTYDDFGFVEEGGNTYIFINEDDLKK